MEVEDEEAGASTEGAAAAVAAVAVAAAIMAAVVTVVEVIMVVVTVVEAIMVVATIAGVDITALDTGAAALGGRGPLVAESSLDRHSPLHHPTTRTSPRWIGTRSISRAIRPAIRLVFKTLPVAGWVVAGTPQEALLQ